MDKATKIELTKEKKCLFMRLGAMCFCLAIAVWVGIVQSKEINRKQNNNEIYSDRVIASVCSRGSRTEKEITPFNKVNTYSVYCIDLIYEYNEEEYRFTLDEPDIPEFVDSLISPADLGDEYVLLINPNNPEDWIWGEKNVTFFNWLVVVIAYAGLLISVIAVCISLVQCCNQNKMEKILEGAEK